MNSRIAALWIVPLATVVVLVLAAAQLRAGHHEKGHDMAAAPAHPLAKVKHAVAFVRPTKGNNIGGAVHFYRTGHSVRVTGQIAGFEPNSIHGFHVHEYGDCTAADGTSAGGHYNPEGHHHGGPDAEARHAGDFGNITADAEGVASFDFTLDNISIGGAKNPVIGHAVIVHAGEDDLTSQPTGAAGARMGCGVIGVGKPVEEKAD